MTLKIRNFAFSDYGKYRCFARNSLGSTEGSIRVYGMYFSFLREKLAFEIDRLILS